MQNKKILPPTYLLLSIIMMLAFHFVLPITKIMPSPWNIFGLVPLIVGIVVAVSADNMFHRVNTTVNPFAESTALVIQGVFHFSRNPMYLGFALVLIGVAILLGSLTPYIVVIVFLWLMNKVFIETEEHMLEEKFGETYLAYKQRVRRWI